MARYLCAIPPITVHYHNLYTKPQPTNSHRLLKYTFTGTNVGQGFHEETHHCTKVIKTILRKKDSVKAFFCYIPPYADGNK